jgi:hypothetical protein
LPITDRCFAGRGGGVACVMLEAMLAHPPLVPVERFANLSYLARRFFIYKNKLVCINVTGIHPRTLLTNGNGESQVSSKDSGMR